MRHKVRGINETPIARWVPRQHPKSIGAERDIEQRPGKERQAAVSTKTERPLREPRPSAQPVAGLDRPQDLFRTGDVLQILGLSRRQLQYWVQTDLIIPSARTRGGHCRYSFEDLVALKTAKRLLNAGVSVQRIRSSIQELRRMLPGLERPLSELTLVATGDVVLVFHGGTAFEAVTGQEWVFEVAQFQAEVEAWQNQLGNNRLREQRGNANLQAEIHRTG